MSSAPLHDTPRDTAPRLPRRRRLAWQLLAVLIVIAAGLASRKARGIFPAGFGKYPGDALWTVMVFFLWGAALPAASTLRVGAIALATSYAVELSQIYQAPWINAIRSTTLGHLVLGSAFDPKDLFAYAVGALAAVLCECAFRWARPASGRKPAGPP